MKEAIHLKYLIVNETDLLWGITVNSVGYQHITPQMAYPPSNHPSRYLFSTQKGRILDEYQLLYIVRGKGYFASGSSKQQSVKEGCMFLLFPGEWHNYRPEKQIGWDEYWIGFKGANIDNRVLTGFFNKQKPIFRIGLYDEVIQLYRQAIEVAENQQVGFQQLLAGIVNHLLGLAYSLDKKVAFEGNNMTLQINKAKVVLRERILEDIDLELVAKDLNMSYSWFRRKFREYTGFAPAQYVQELKLQKAKELLTNSSLSSKEIAFQLRFDDPEYFSSFFKKRNNMTPIQYRDFTQGKVLK